MGKHIGFTGLWLWVALMAMVVACSPSAQVDEPAEVASEELQAIDSLMWRQPDSALAQLQRFVVSPEADSLDEFNGHYCQVLVAELLYKNDWGQSNREELLQAVAYFDSIMQVPEPVEGPSFERNVFLAARAHYINGAGYYEKDSIVQACAEYLKALEVMEAHFEERELVKKKAIFMTYTYNRLMELFSSQFMMDPAIECGEKALMFCRIEPTSPEGVSNILYRLGKQYDKMHEIDKARLYYSQALESITKKDNIVYRDIVSSKVLCDYKAGGAAEPSLDELYHVLLYANTENERLNRYLTVGGIHFLERNYDSAIFYLEPVFEDNEAGLQTQAAGYLRIVYDSIGDVEKSNVYMRFLTNQKKPDGENKALVSKLEDLYKNYSNKKLEKQAEAEREKAKKKVLNTVVPIAIAVALAIFCVLIWRNRRQLKHQQEEAGKALGEAEQEHEKELRLWQAVADKTLEETEKKYEAELEQLKTETKQHLAEAEKKHQQWMADAEERLLEELRTQKDRADKEMEKTKKRHEKELEAERLAYRAEMAEKEAKAQTERRLHEETLTRHQVETEQRMSEAERKHRQKMEEIARKHELEMQAQHDKTEKEAEQTRKRHASELEAERMAYQTEREALRESIRQREAQVNALETAMVQQREEAERRREAFLKEEICQRILDLLHGKHITSRDTSFQHGIGLKEEDFKQLKDAVERHYKGFDNMLLSQCPSLKQSDLTLCHLHLMGLGEGEIAALRSRTYSGIKKQNESLQEKLGVKGSVAEYVLRTAEGLCVPQGVLQDVSQKILQGILDIVSINPKITREEMANQLGVSSKTVGRYLKKLGNRVRYVGSGYSGHWEVVR